MNENKKKTYTADEFKAICKDMVPMLDALLQTVRKNGIEGYVRVSVNSDGYINMEGGGLCGWELNRYSDDGQYTARYSYSEPLELGKGEQE